MKQDIYSRPTPAAQPAAQPALCRYVRTRRHKPRVVYVIHTFTHVEGEEMPSGSVTSQPGKALALLGQACLDAHGSSSPPFLTAHVEYGFSKFASHPKPAGFNSNFSLAEFAAHHHKWKQDVTDYALPTDEKETL